MLDANLKKQLKAYLVKIPEPIELVAITTTATNPRA